MTLTPRVLAAMAIGAPSWPSVLGSLVLLK